MTKNPKSKFIIGLTGTIGSGKSSVACMLGELGADIIDTDKVAREVVEPGTEGLTKLIEKWGEKILNDDRTLNRETVSGIVFKNSEELQWLNSVLHPLIGIETARRVRVSEASVIVLEVPLLFESGMEKMVMQSWVVTANERILIERVCARDGCTDAEARARLETQMPQEEKKERAHVIIDNGGTLEETRLRVREAWGKIEKS